VSTTNRVELVGKSTDTVELKRIADDPELFEAFYRAHVEAVQRFIARRVRDPYDAADLTADVFVAVIDSAHTYRPSRGTPLAWLYGVAPNVVAADRRRSDRELRVSRTIPAGRLLVDADDLARLHERLDAEAEARRLYVAMERLPEGERAVLEFVALEELSAREAAKALGISQVAARVRLHRARRLLQHEWRSSAHELTQRASEAPS
jgi:RNA polymerase sigma-70 factor, ECF subfamily